MAQYERRQSRVPKPAAVVPRITIEQFRELGQRLRCPVQDCGGAALADPPSGRYIEIVCTLCSRVAAEIRLERQSGQAMDSQDYRELMERAGPIQGARRGRPPKWSRDWWLKPREDTTRA